MKHFQLATILFAMLFTASASAATINFNLFDQTSTYYDEGDIEGLDESASFAITRSGLIATFSANMGVLNQTSSAFGINGLGSGDDTDHIDCVNNAEEVSVIFSQEVRLEALEFHSIGSADIGKVLLPSRGLMDVALDVDGLSTLILAGQAIVIQYVAGNGFSFDSFTVTTVPLPSAAWLFISALGGLLVAKRKQLKA